MGVREAGRERPGDGEEVAAAVAGDEAAFAALVERHQAELQLHCYRFLGSIPDAEDQVQETLLRAWARRHTFEGRSSFRAWLYGIATHTCLDALRRRSRRVTPPEVTGPADPAEKPERATDIVWLEPYPDRLLESIAATEAGPELRLISRESTELAFLAAIQYLSPRQRATLILRDVVGWSAKETAEALRITVPSVNSALQRARQTLRQRWSPPHRDTAAGSRTTEAERTLLTRMVDAWERTDADAVAALLTSDARLVMPPTTSWYDGREAVRAFLVRYAFAAALGRFRALPTAANRQPAFGLYRRDDDDVHQPLALIVLTVDREAVSEIAMFHLPRLVMLAGLPASFGPA